MALTEISGLSEWAQPVSATPTPTVRQTNILFSTTKEHLVSALDNVITTALREKVDIDILVRLSASIAGTVVFLEPWHHDVTKLGFPTAE